MVGQFAAFNLNNENICSAFGIVFIDSANTMWRAYMKHLYFKYVFIRRTGAHTHTQAYMYIYSFVLQNRN